MGKKILIFKIEIIYKLVGFTKKENLSSMRKKGVRVEKKVIE